MGELWWIFYRLNLDRNLGYQTLAGSVANLKTEFVRTKKVGLGGIGEIWGIASQFTFQRGLNLEFQRIFIWIFSR